MPPQMMSVIFLHLSVMFIHIALDHQLQKTYTVNFHEQTYKKKFFVPNRCPSVEQNSRRFEKDVKERVRRKIKFSFIQQFRKTRLQSAEISKLDLATVAAAGKG